VPARSPEQAEAELLRLRRENESLRAQRDVLKKALGILAEAPPSVTRA
jgi:transposase-like protein